MRSRRPWRRWPRAWSPPASRAWWWPGRDFGAVVGALDVTALRIGPEIDPGVPWTASVGAKPLLLALKSGNFGAPDFFTKAFQLP